MTAQGILSPSDMAAFEAEGFIFKRPPLSDQELDEAEATFDRLVGGASKELDEGYIKLISHPWFEAVAQQVLRAEHVRYIELGAHHRPAASEGSDTGGADYWKKAWRSGAHIDLQVTKSDFDATPRRDMLALWFWVSDVTPERAAMRILPGSHRRIQQHWEKILTPEHKSSLPRVHGLFPNPSTQYPSYPEFIPEPDDFKYTECEPTPVAVPRGTAQIFVSQNTQFRHPHSPASSRTLRIASMLPRADTIYVALILAQLRQRGAQRIYLVVDGCGRSLWLRGGPVRRPPLIIPETARCHCALASRT